MELTEKYGGNLIVDEAHAVGLYQKGLICELGFESRVFARIVTFGKALGCHGAIILGSALLREYLINFSRSFIYTTAASFPQLASVKMAYKLLASGAATINELTVNIKVFKNTLAENKGLKLIQSESAIHCLVAGSNHKAAEMAARLQQAGLDVRPILSPTVPAGTERLRICLHSYNTADQTALLTRTLNKYSYA